MTPLHCGATNGLKNETGPQSKMADMLYVICSEQFLLLLLLFFGCFFSLHTLGTPADKAKTLDCLFVVVLRPNNI